MTITPDELRDVEIRSEMRGNNRDEVNKLLEKAAVTIEELTARLAD
jgi:cell division septum initiation protein DivIVA